MSARPASADPATAAPRQAVAALASRAPSACFHCGLPNPQPSRFRAPIQGVQRDFCCAGCAAIAQTIRAAGLDAFYARRTEPAARARPERAADDFDAWDDAAAHAGLVRIDDGRAEASLLLEGIHCGACVWLIESWLARQPGVAGASANFATRRARVVWDPRATSLSALLRAVARIGYRAYPYDPARREALARHESRALLLRMAVALLAMMQVMMFAVPAYVTVDGVDAEHQRLLHWASLTLTLPALLYSAFPFFRGAWRDLRVRRPGMDVPVALGIGAAFAASAVSTYTGSGAVYYDSVTMFVALLLVARYVELAARRRAGDAIEALARARPASADRLVDWPARDDVDVVAAATLARGDLVRVRPGATVPADGTVVDGRASVEEALVTGESNPLAKAQGAAVLAGSVLHDGTLVVRVDAAGESTHLAAIERLSERAAAQRPRIARVADRVAVVFVGALLALACAVALVWWHVDPSRALAVTFALLVVSCPCALSLATPAALAAAAGALSRRHVVVANADAIEVLARATHVVLDKTGTLTTGRLALERVVATGRSTRERALTLAAALEAASEHPVARALRVEAAGVPGLVARDVAIAAGQGVEGVVDGTRLRIGSIDYVAALSRAPLAPPANVPDHATLIALGSEHGVLAWFVLADRIRPGARDLVERLAALRIVPVLLSGDRSASVRAAAASLGIDDARGDLLPDQKRAAVAALQAQGAVVAMAGDGINDAPSLAQAQVSVSLGSATPLAQRAADVVVLGDELPAIADAIVHARRTLRVVRENLGWAFAYNAIAIPAAALGFVSPLAAAIGMSASSLVVVVNALRVARLGAPPVRADAARAERARLAV
jgi:Cu2+-exporting ATPase